METEIFISGLSEELFIHISTFLANVDLKNLRLVNKGWASRTPLNIRRIFISPSYRNIEVFQSIANHDQYRCQVEEIIWDDAKFEQYNPIIPPPRAPSPEHDNWSESDDSEYEKEIPIIQRTVWDTGHETLDRAPHPWEVETSSGSDYGDSDHNVYDDHNLRPMKTFKQFRQVCRENLDRWAENDLSCERKKRASPAGLFRAKTGREPRADEQFLSVDDYFKLYNQYYREQQEIISSGLDEQTLRDSLHKFPSLKRFTITPEAHRWSICAPRYPTPMIRSFPPTFNYPAPWTWQEATSNNAENPRRDHREDFHGLTVALKVLSQSQTPVPELLIDVNREDTGIPYHFFESPSDSLTHFQTICTGLQRLELAINVRQVGYSPGMEVLTNGNLERALKSATKMEHFAIHTNAWEGDDQYPWESPVESDLFEAIPVGTWPSLRTLGLSKVPFNADEFIAFLKQLPADIDSVQFDDVQFVDADWVDVLPRIRDELHWRPGMPNVTITQTSDREGSNFRRIWAEDEVATFLGGGANPFAGGLPGAWLQWDFATVRDDFDDSVCHPYLPEPPIKRRRIAPGYWEVVTIDRPETTSS